MSKLKKHIGFTLAEIIIVLGIIGIIAELTIPLLVINTQKNITVSKLAKVFSDIQNATTLSQIDNGPIDDWDMSGTFGSPSYDAGKIFADKYILPYLKVTKYCTPKTTECWGQYNYYMNGDSDSYLNLDNNTFYSVMLANGVVLGFWPRNYVTEINIDINGNSPPNTSGKDLFYMVITKASDAPPFGTFTNPGVYFYGNGYDRTYLKTSGYPCAKNGTLPGVYCGALIQKDGWKISDDYPW